MTRPVVPLAERVAAGKARRSAVPRTSHAEWSAPGDRTDPVALVEAANTDRVSELVPIRHGRMAVSAFTFFRGTAEIMASDLAATPRTGWDAQLCGDCHLSNFGLYATPERNLVFDINDFDETIRGPWEWDVKRLATSFEIAGRDVGIDRKRRRSAVTRVLRSYRDRLREYAAMSPLQIRYDRRDLADIIAMTPDRATRNRRQSIAKKAGRRDSGQLLPKLAAHDGSGYRIIDNPPVIVHSDEPDWQVLVADFLDRYRMSLRPEIRQIFDRYHFADAAMKVSGVGSVGTRCFIALFLSDDDQPLFLQAKEAGPSSLARYLPAGETPELGESVLQGERVVVGQRIMQSASDMLLGFARSGRGRDFYVRQLRDMKYSFDLANATPDEFMVYADYCGWVLARAHASSVDAATITGYLGQGTQFDEAGADFATAYADQNEADYSAFTVAIADGRILAVNEV